MIPRFTTKEMADLWSEENKYHYWLKVEQAVAWAQAQIGMIPKSAARKIEKAKFNLKQIEKFETITKHDLIAFLKSVETTIGAAGRFLHFGLTSYDIVDTALALRLIQACDYINKALTELLATIKKLALNHKQTLMIGRTHGMYAQPITFGFKCLSWYEEMKRNITRLRQVRENLRFGKISGAVGTYSTVPPNVEVLTLRRLGLKPEPVATQVIPRDRHAELLTTLAIIAGSLERIATEVRNLQRSDIAELAEPFTAGQTGSSAMPHKRNPELSERICGLARIVRANALAGLETIALWHERDLTNSSVERITLPDSTILIHYMIKLLTQILQGLVVFPEQMRKNLAKTFDQYFSQNLMIALIKKKMAKSTAYKITQELSFQAGEKKMSLKDLAMKNPQVKKYLNEKELTRIFDINTFLANIDYIYKKSISDN
uniref:Adenylosuccinate lyase n=1 Tax=candidate division WOR-3 bacterium TaxID=2052148 RepID=A0A7C6EF05_UNCW3